MRNFFFILLLVLHGVPVHARQDPAPVRKAIDAWLQIQTSGLPGEVSWDIGALDPANQLAPCKSFDIARPAGGRPWGRTNLVVRCLGETGWRVFIPVHVRVKSAYLISARPVAHGQTLVEEDLTTEFGDLSELPASTVTDPLQAIGKTASTSIPAGRPLRSDQLKAPVVVRQGQTVKVVSRGAGFAVGNDGRALNNASPGQVVQVRLSSGQVLSGIADAHGVIQVSY
jgi:flagella basal body P-ring formation protein FlgA